MLLHERKIILTCMGAAAAIEPLSYMEVCRQLLSSAKARLYIRKLDYVHWQCAWRVRAIRISGKKLMTVRHWISGVMLVSMMALAAPAPAQVTVSVNVAPPELVVYDQPPIPGDGYIWTPGYWAWSDDDQDYYWIPGTWVEAPEVGYLWTPGYWEAENDAFLWHAGYWGPQIGFYGGVYYGYGYFGHGYQGGYWQGGHLYYNTAVSNIGTVHITNVYNRTVINNVTLNRTSYNGGSGGIRAQPTSAELQASQAHHIDATPVQRQQEQAARGNPSLRASVNHGNPPIAATSRPGVFSGAGVVAARHTGTMSIVGAQPRAATPAPRGEAEQRSPAQRPEVEQRGATTRPQTPRPETRAPETRQPEARQPETRQPETRQPETRQPENAQPRETPRAEPRPAAAPAPRPEPPRPAPRQPERPPEGH